MPKDTMERAIKKGAGGEGQNLQEVTYEGYAPNGIAIFIEATTDNLNRTVANVRSIFNKYNGSLGTNGSLSFIFNQKGVFQIEKEKITNTDIEELEMELIDGGAEELEIFEEFIEVKTSFEDFGLMQQKLEDLQIEPKSSELQRIPNNQSALDVESAKKVLSIIEKFEEDDDVNNVYHNLELTEELLTELNS